MRGGDYRNQACDGVTMPRIGLVLGGGGITGTAFHAGVITALAEAGWDARDADIIVGTSAGSTAAALMRAGLPPKDYLPRVVGEPVSAEGARVLNRIGRIPQPPPRRRGSLRPASPELLRAIARRPWQYPFGVRLAATLPVGTVAIEEVNPGFGPLFDSWPLNPMWITAVDLGTGRRAVFGREDTASVPDAVSASCAIPGYFAPVEISGRRYVDGGAHSVNNLDLVIGEPLDLVIVSAPLSTLDAFALETGNVPRAAIRRQLDREVRAVRRAGIPVEVFAPDARLRSIMGINSMDLRKRPAVARAAREYTIRRVRSGFPPLQ